MNCPNCDKEFLPRTLIEEADEHIKNCKFYDAVLYFSSKFSSSANFAKSLTIGDRLKAEVREINLQDSPRGVGQHYFAILRLTKDKS